MFYKTMSSWNSLTQKLVLRQNINDDASYLFGIHRVSGYLLGNFISQSPYKVFFTWQVKIWDSGWSICPKLQKEYIVDMI